LKDEQVKVTLSLTKSSVEFFKKEARKHGTRYQKMIRALVDRYVEHNRSA
ncbi:MAG: CopG family transcriptional regulator, partial [Phycisphaerae bacterium]|nr:CopG family transcriptional regulator [Synergistaceae bacterium]NLX05265.1 CopG family transcriptional regulator [Phycisphaerae bacterium]